MKQVLIFTFAAAFLAGSAWAEVGLSPAIQQTVESKAPEVEALPNTSLGLQAPSFSSLLDPTRFSIQHSAGMTYTSGSLVGMQQYYLGNITYKAAEPLTIRAQVGVSNTLFGTPIGGPGASATRLIVPDVSVLYQPKDNLRIEFRFSQGGYNMPGRQWGDFWY